MTSLKEPSLSSFPNNVMSPNFAISTPVLFPTSVVSDTFEPLLLLPQPANKNTTNNTRTPFLAISPSPQFI
ncbi:hypothetical protein D3C77_754140 [compost metagenome]